MPSNTEPHARFERITDVRFDLRETAVRRQRSPDKENMRMKIAIIGSGISGLTAAHYLQDRADIVIYEANHYPGGHTNTVQVDTEADSIAIDTGFIVFNDWTYPNFMRLLDELAVTSRPTTMSFSVQDRTTGIEYNGHNLNTLFAQRRNILRPRFLRLVRDILRFCRESRQQVATMDPAATVDEFLTTFNYSEAFRELYLCPMGAAIWSCPVGTFGEFPIGFVIKFYAHHGLLNLTNRPTWRVVEGGSKTYVDRLLARFSGRVKLNSPVQNVSREGEAMIVLERSGERTSFDHVILACHSDQALRILGDSATGLERHVLGGIPYNRNVATLHTDTSLLPRKRRAWAAWNYRTLPDRNHPACVTYDMNLLQHIESPDTYCVTLNGEAMVDPQKIIRSIEYHHPVFTTRRQALQSRHDELINRNGRSFCGAYWGNGFHEDGVNSALKVVSRLIEHSMSTGGNRSVEPVA